MSSVICALIVIPTKLLRSAGVWVMMGASPGQSSLSGLRRTTRYGCSFGGFSPSFYSGYDAEWALDEDYEQRRPWYQLYHVLNHVNMFGGGYEKQAARMINELLARYS